MVDVKKTIERIESKIDAFYTILTDSGLRSLLKYCFCLTNDKTEIESLSEQMEDVKKTIEIIENKIDKQGEEVRRGLEKIKEHVIEMEQTVAIDAVLSCPVFKPLMP